MGVSAIPPPRPKIIYEPASTAPEGYLKANGAVISRTAYAWLFALIGTTYGAGDGSTTFGLPDLRGEFLRCWDDSRGIDSGRVLGSAQSGQMQSHVHGIPYAVQDHADYYGGSGSTYGIGGSGDNGVNTLSTGTGAETRPRNIAFLACIAYAP